jgi:hypothetical protein
VVRIILKVLHFCEIPTRFLTPYQEFEQCNVHTRRTGVSWIQILGILMLVLLDVFVAQHAPEPFLCINNAPVCS